jgi:DNA-binding CsgD family transcriptional regulator
MGLTNAEAGLELGISGHAVKFHLARVYRKLGVANRTEAAVTYLLNRDAPRQASG